MFKITLAEKELKGDIPTYEFEDNEKFLEFTYQFVNENLAENNVLVCFHDEIKQVNESFLVSKCFVAVTDFIDSYCDKENFCEEFNSCSFNIFAFATFEEAFDYCKDLKEGQ